MAKQEYSPHKRARIITSHANGLPYKVIAAQEGVSRHSIFGIVQRYKGQTKGQSHKRSGRPPLLSDRYKRRIFRSIDQDPFISSTELVRQLSLPCSPTTVTRWLKKEGIQHSLALRRPKLTDKHAKKRLEFARKYFNKPMNFWKRWVFSDEFTVARGDGDITGWVFAKKGERLL